LSLLKGAINSTFILSNCDIIIDEDIEKIYRHHKENNYVITMVCSLKKIIVPYGVIELNDSGEIANMKEKPELPFFINTGMYIVEPKVLNEMEENQFIGFPDIIEKYRSIGDKVGVFPISEDSWMDMGQLNEMDNMINKMIKE